MISFKESFNDEVFIFKIDENKKRVIVETGKTSVMCHVSVSSEIVKDRSFSESGFKSFGVFFESRFSSVNKIPGGFKKRDMILDQDIVISRLVDRCIRPLISNDYDHDVRVFLQVLSYDHYSLEVLSVLATSLILNILGVIEEPVSLCKISGEKINAANKYNSKFKFFSAFSGEHSVVVDYEAMGDFILKDIEAYKTVLEKVFKITYTLALEMNEFQSRILAKVNVQKYVSKSLGFFDRFKAWRLSKRFYEILKDNLKDYSKCLQLLDSFEYDRKKDYVYNSYIRNLLHSKISAFVLKNKRRLDGRALLDNTNLPISSDVRETVYIKDFVNLPKGCCLIARGDTEVVCSLSVADSMQSKSIDSLDGKSFENLIVSYNFLPHLNSFKKNGVSRREIGHSELIRKALVPILKNSKDVVRVVCDVIAADGATSMTSVSGASLLMYRNGLIKDLVGGISIGLIKHENACSFLVDLNHFEDEFLSLIDCKVTGTKNIITAMQLDCKEACLTYKDFTDLLKIVVIKLHDVLDSLYAISFVQPSSILADKLILDDVLKKDKVSFNKHDSCHYEMANLNEKNKNRKLNSSVSFVDKNNFSNQRDIEDKKLDKKKIERVKNNNLSNDYEFEDQKIVFKDVVNNYSEDTVNRKKKSTNNVENQSKSTKNSNKNDAYSINKEKYPLEISQERPKGKIVAAENKKKKPNQCLEISEKDKFMLVKEKAALEKTDRDDEKQSVQDVKKKLLTKPHHKVLDNVAKSFDLESGKVIFDKKHASKGFPLPEMDVSAKNDVDSENVEDSNMFSLCLDIDIARLSQALYDSNASFSSLSHKFNVEFKVEGKHKLRLYSLDHNNILESVKFIKALL